MSSYFRDLDTGGFTSLRSRQFAYLSPLPQETEKNLLMNETCIEKDSLGWLSDSDTANGCGATERGLTNGVGK